MTLFECYIVDDDQSLLEVSKLLLAEQDNRLIIDSASSVNEAFSKIAAVSYDAIVSDFEMPLKTGLDFLKELKLGNQAFSQIPFILFTGKGREEIAIQALNLGADGYFNKQGDPATVYGELAHGIKNAVNSRKAKLALKESEEKFEAYVESSPTAIFVVNPEAQYVYVNEAACRLLRYTRQELLNMTIRQIIFEQDLNEGLVKFEEAKKKGRSWKQATLKSKNCLPVPVNLYINKLPDGNLIGYCEDITERKNIEHVLRESQEKFIKAFKYSPNGISITRLSDGKIIDANDSIIEILGYTIDEIIGKKTFDLGIWANEEDRKNLASMLTQYGYVRHNECEIVKKDGSRIIIDLSASLLDIGNEKCLISSFVDITQRKNAEERLRRSEERYRFLAETSRDVIWTMDLQGHFTYMSPSVLKLRGYSPEEVLKQSITDALTPDSAKIILEGFQQFHQTGDIPPKNYFQLEQFCKDGSTVWTEVSMDIIRDGNGQPQSILGVSRDITDRKKAEEQLELTAGLFDLANDQIIVHDLEGKIIYCNEAICKQTGYSKKEILSMNLGSLDSTGSAEKIPSFTKELLLKGSLVFESEHQHKDKTHMPVEVHARIIDLGKNKLVLSIVRDITERKKAEEKLKLNQSKLENLNEKLQVVGSLTRHDVRNKLSIIKANIYLLRKHLPNDTQLSKYLDAIDLSVNQSSRIFEFSHLYEKIGLEKLTEIDIADTFNEATTLIPDLKIQITNKCEGLKVLADSLLRQLFYNLIDNSINHGKHVTEIKLNYLRIKNELCLFYEDNGVGIPYENKAKIFSGEFSTSNRSGLGLKLVKKLIEAYRWKITEEGIPGKGAKFVLIIPIEHIISEIPKKTKSQGFDFPLQIFPEDKIPLELN